MMEGPILVAGIDEAGRGPLAGPVVAAAVILDPARKVRGLRDSKLMTPEQRESVAAVIRERAIAWAVASSDVGEIDALNILRATLLAMRRAFDGLSVRPVEALVDGDRCPQLACPAYPIVKGDRDIAAISAASIIAKTTRDAMLDAMDKEYPGYGFASHKGYPTPEHKAAIVKLGVADVHRMSFPALHELQGEFSTRFYDLRTQLFAAETRDALGALEASFKSCASSMEERESKKLKLLISRRWKVLA